MLRALSRTASIKSSNSGAPSSGGAINKPPTLDPNQPSEPARPCVFTDNEIRTTTSVDARVEQDTTVEANGVWQATGSLGSSSLRRLVPNEVGSGSGSSSSSSGEETDVEEPKMPSLEQNKRKSSWYSWWGEEKPAGEEGEEGSSWAFWQKNNSGNGQVAIKGTQSEDHPKPVKKPHPHQQQKQQHAPVRGKTIKPNIVTPTVQTCFAVNSQSHKLKASITKLGDYLNPKPHKYQEWDPLLRNSPRKIKKAVVIGVHGFFPAKVVRSILGEPTGTSIKFANEAAGSVQRWADEKGYQVEIEKIALEGEGKVLDRVDHLYKLLQNFINLVHEADFVYFAAHSQGTPVAVHLLARLVEEGHVENKQLALLGMAGISLGPVSGLDTKLVMRAYSSIESASLSELFQFQRLNSLQSRKYLDSLRTIVAHDAKIAFVGSMNDQLVPLYSSTSIHISHPNIFRGVYVDGQDVVAPEFLSTLISLSLQLRNTGSSDHDVIKELSGGLTGPLTGGGHSKIYNEPQVYDLMVRHALETTSASKSLPVHVDESFQVPPSLSSSNPYLLPWCMRGLMNEATARHELHPLINELVVEFQKWQPESKLLKDVKYRLSAISLYSKFVNNRAKL